MSSTGLIVVAAALVSLLASTAAAQTTFPIAASDITIGLLTRDDDNNAAFLVAADLAQLLSVADCQCQRPLLAEVAINNAGAAPLVQAGIYVGTTCDTARDTVDLNNRCKQVQTKTLQHFIGQRIEIPINAADLINPVGTCGSTQSTSANSVFVLIDQNGDFVTPDAAKASDPITHDTQPPPAPLTPSLVPGDGALAASWDIASGDADTFGFQLFCVREDAPTTPIFSGASAFSAAYETVGTLSQCPKFPPRSLTVADGPSLTRAVAATTPLPDGLATLDPSFLCSGRIDGTSKSQRITKLTNDVAYRVAMVAIDRAGNPSAPLDLGVESPVPVQDLFQRYRAAGGASTGGFCAAGGTPSGAGETGTLLMLCLVLLTRRRTATDTNPTALAYAGGEPPAEGAPAVRPSAGMRPPTATTTARPATEMLLRATAKALPTTRWHKRSAARSVTLVAGLVALFGSAADEGPAQAQTMIQDDVDQPVTPRIRTPQTDGRFAFELKFGPYRPNIDHEFANGQAPYDDIFGSGSGLMSQFEFDVALWRRLGGTFAVGATTGYFSKSANGLLRNGAPSGDKTAIKLVPLVLQGIYRYEELARRTPVPLVPYAKLGVNYTIWWITNGAGDVAESEGNKARGGTWGWQGNFGLALQLDRFDRDASTSLHNELGVSHVNLFWELLVARVSNFGRDGALNVGATSWLAGLSFQF
jgi:hypothetical protein